MGRVSGELHDKELRRYLLHGESVVASFRQHWVAMVRPALVLVGTTVLALFVAASLDADGGPVLRLLFAIWLAVLLWFAFRWMVWRRDWFVATDKRLFTFYGFITRKAAMMPLGKVTDMTYRRDIPGRLLGYGDFILESAGQDQALHEIRWVPHPDTNYQAICAQMFGERRYDTDDTNLAAGPGPHGGYGGGTGGRPDPDDDAGPSGRGPSPGPETDPGGRRVERWGSHDHDSAGTPEDPEAWDDWSRTEHQGGPARDRAPTHDPDGAPPHGPFHPPDAAVSAWPEADDEDDAVDASRAIRVRRPVGRIAHRRGPAPADGESIYRSPDLRRDPRQADTGPIPITPRR